MENKILIYVFWTLFIGVNSRQVRIIGGEDTTIEEFPFLVQIKLIGSDELVCGGTIISNRHILTAAHCVYDRNFRYLRYLVEAGRTNLSDPAPSRYIVSDYYIHSGFQGRTIVSTSTHNDIAILVLNRRIVFNDKQNKIELPTEDVLAGSQAYMSGWGKTFYPNGQFANTLKKMAVEIIDFHECEVTFPYPICLDQICTFGEGKNAATGDSGGPVISNGKVVGIISFSIPWINDLPQININVFSHLSFIRTIIGY